MNDPKQCEVIRDMEVMIPLRQTVVYSRAERDDLARIIVERLGDTFDALNTQIMLKQAEHIIADALEINKENAISGVQGKRMELLGAVVETKRVTAYEYAGAKYEQLEAKAKAAADELKEYREFLRKLKTDVADTETGEIITRAKCTKDGITIAITLP